MIYVLVSTGNKVLIKRQCWTYEEAFDYADDIEKRYKKRFKVEIKTRRAA